MQQSSNDLYKRKNRKLIPDMIRKAVIINVFQTATSLPTIDIYFVNNPQTIVKGVLVSGAVNFQLLTNGARCIVCVFDESNAKDMIVLATY